MDRTPLLPTSELDYHLPPELIATTPAEPRDSARLLVVSRSNEARLEDRRVSDLPSLLDPGDLLVVNRTRVLPARLLGRKAGSGGQVPGLFLHAAARDRWIVMLKGSRLRAGVQIELLDARGNPAGVVLTLGDRAEEGWICEVAGLAEGEGASEALQRAGATPLPPYILKARRDAGMDLPDERDRDWYQTVYAHERRPGSVAAPTAGLHFTTALLQALASRSVDRAEVLLDVGLGTFRPVETSTVEEHPIHAEHAEVPAETLGAIARARGAGGRSIAVGTTTARALESVSAGADSFTGETRLLITPGHQWRQLDGLMTNFHLPQSTLLAMVAALFPGGAARVREIYNHAVAARYRFYSYGDAMLILS